MAATYCHPLFSVPVLWARHHALSHHLVVVNKHGPDGGVPFYNYSDSNEDDKVAGPPGQGRVRV